MERAREDRDRKGAKRVARQIIVRRLLGYQTVGRAIERSRQMGMVNRNSEYAVYLVKSGKQAGYSSLLPELYSTARYRHTYVFTDDYTR